MLWGRLRTTSYCRGVNQALADFSDIEIQLYGDESKIKQYLTAANVSASSIQMKIDSDDEPTKLSVRRKCQHDIGG